jgi:hypothetical protein
MTDEELATVLLTYQGLIEPSFVPMMTQTWVRCESEVAREACRDNLDCEVNEDHPRMLRDFVAPLWRFDVRDRVGAALRNGRPLVEALERETRLSGVHGLTVMAALENASCAFIPWMEDAAKRAGVQDLTYTQKHGVADERHAEEFLAAVEAEMQVAEVSFDSGPLNKAYSLLHHIFHAHQAV